ncbi:hypothetical protein ACMATS_38325 (plasmid) [Streptoverticillium reticulum]|uniref:hypothetical protein n=1 Tax=Streptoverticillium reticulum TaxID=1433415 RepID=UPI0039BFDDFA
MRGHAHGHICQLADQLEHVYDTRSWTYRTQHHLLLDLGRRFTTTPTTPAPRRLPAMPAGQCCNNAARYAHARHEHGLVYAEGFALDVAGAYLPHAWCVRPDGSVLDPTWQNAPGRAYIGMLVADRRLWPVEGGGLLEDFRRLLPILRDGLPQQALAVYGRPL